jgi:hypothetical protein
VEIAVELEGLGFFPEADIVLAFRGDPLEGDEEIGVQSLADVKQGESLERYTGFATYSSRPC